MTYTFTTRNGQRVEVAVAAAFDGLAAAFKAATGCDLLVTSGTRTRAEQEAIFRQRYVTAAGIKGRKVYETRNWNGVLWYRISAAGTVAIPGSSNHEDDGPIGPRALDLRDSGADRGVTTRGTARDKWMEAHAPEHGFKNDGYGFGEPWHKTFQGNLGTPAPTPPAAPPTSTPVSTTGRATVRRGSKGQLVLSLQNRLNSRYPLYSKLRPDGDFGAATEKVVKEFQRRAGLVPDGIVGPKTWGALGL